MAGKMKFIKDFYILIIFITITGVVAGKLTGDYILASALRGNITFLTFIFSPSQSFIETHSLINESDDYKRLAGYYAYKESGLIDPEFLLERYKNEDSDIIKNVIIWIVEENSGKEKLVDFYKKIYNLSPESIKKKLISKIEK